VLSVLYYRYEEEKDQDPETPQLARSPRPLSAWGSDEEPQEGSEQEGMPRKGASMKVGDLVSVVYDDGEKEMATMPYTGVGLVVKIEEAADATWVHLHTGEDFKIDKLEVINESR